MNGGSPRELIIEVLRKHPEGLTITAISEFTKLHRHTVTKYLYELRGAEIIYEREIGPARLCYLKDGITKKKERETLKRLNNRNMKATLGQMQILAVVLFLVLVPAAIIAAQNATNGTFENNSIPVEGYLTAVNETPDSNLTGSLEEVVNDTAENETAGQEEPDNATTGDNVTVEEETGFETNMTLNITENETTNETVGNETIVEPPNITINETINETVPEEPEDMPEINESLNETEETKAALKVEIISPDKVNRGESFEMEALVINTGSAPARNVRIEWILPEGFVILSGSDSIYCQEIPPGESCHDSIIAVASLTSHLGLGDIRVRVSYSD